MKKPKATRTPQPQPWYAKALTDPALQKRADTQVNAAIAAATAPINAARAEAARKAAAQQQAILGLGRASADILSRVAPATQQGYSQAAQETGDLARGFSAQAAGAVKQGQDANAAYNQQMTGAAGAPAVDTTSLQDTLYGLGGYQPGASLEAQGAAAGAYANALPAIGELQTKQQYETALGAGAADDKQYEQQLLDLAAKRPDMKNQVVDELYKLELSRLQARLSVSDQNLKVKAQAADIKLKNRAQHLYEQQFGETKKQDAVKNAIDRHGIFVDNQNLKLAQGKQRADVLKALASGQEVNAAASRAAGYLMDKTGQPVLDASGKRIKVSKYASGGSAKTPADTYGKAVQDARELYGNPVVSQAVDPDTGDPLPGKYLAKPGAKGVYRRPGTPARTDDPQKARTDSNMNFAEAQAYLMETYGLPRVKARRALVAAGWKPDGQRPKPRADIHHR